METEQSFSPDEGEPGKPATSSAGGEGGRGGQGGDGTPGGAGGRGGNWSASDSESISRMLAGFAAQPPQSPKTDQLVHDLTSPVAKMKGLGANAVLFLCSAVMVGSIFVQYQIYSTESLHRQEIYERVQLLQLDQDEALKTSDRILLEMDTIKTEIERVEETAASIEQTVEEAATTVEETATTIEETVEAVEESVEDSSRSIEIPLPLPVIE